MDKIRIQLPFNFSVKPHKQFFPKRRGNNNFPYSQVTVFVAVFFLCFYFYNKSYNYYYYASLFVIKKDSTFGISYQVFYT